MVDVFLSENVQLGADWLSEIKLALNRADIIIVLFSRASQGRPWINIEAGYGVMAEKLVIPVCHSGLAKDRLPVIYGLRQGLNLTDRSDVLKLLETIAAATPARRLLVHDKQQVVDDWMDIISRAAAQTPTHVVRADSPIVVWMIGSVNGVDEGYRDRAFKTAEALADAFIEREYHVVLGRNLLLNYLADRMVFAAQDDEPSDLPQILARKSARSTSGAPNPVIVLGSLRSPHGVRQIFLAAIAKVPDVALIVGGSPDGRAVEEASLARAAGIPVLPLRFTGGAALRTEASFDPEFAQAIENLQATRGSDLIGRLACDLIERQVRTVRQRLNAGPT
jgi:hypothetical protein